MKADREIWHRKKSSFKGWGGLLQCLASVLVLLFAIVVRVLLDNLFGIVDENSIANYIVALLTMSIILVMECWLWRYELVIGLFDVWVENKYKCKTQHNVMIEKYLEDCHWEYYNKILKPLYE